MPFPRLMEHAEEDLISNIEGRFSPEDWEKILKRAEADLDKGGGTVEAWQNVIRDFHRTRYWGFVPNYKGLPKGKHKHIGYQLIWLTLGSLTFMKVLILWYGQIYSRSDSPSDAAMFFLVLAFVIGNIGFFLWRNRNHVD